MSLCHHCHRRLAKRDGMCEHCYADGEAYLFLRYRGHDETCAVGIVWRGRKCGCGLVHTGGDDADVSGS
jgi:hypothetical protein